MGVPVDLSKHELYNILLYLLELLYMLVLLNTLIRLYNYFKILRTALYVIISYIAFVQLNKVHNLLYYALQLHVQHTTSFVIFPLSLYPKCES